MDNTKKIIQTKWLFTKKNVTVLIKHVWLPKVSRLATFKYFRLKILNEFNLSECRPTSVPMASLYEQNEDENLPVLQIIFGFFSLYISNRTRPIMVIKICKKKPSESLFNACKMVLRYLFTYRSIIS